MPTNADGTVAAVMPVLKALREAPLYRQIKLIAAALLSICSILGLVGLAADVRAMSDWIGGLDSWVPYSLAYLVLLAIGLTLLATELLTYRAKAINVPAASAQQSASVDAEESRVETSPEQASTPKPTSRLLSDVLQKQLDEGLRLYRNIPAFPGIPAALTGAETTEADFQNWVRRTKRLLHHEPELLAEFNYQPPPAPFAVLLDRTTPRYKKALEQRKANLAGIIQDLRREDR